MKREYLHKIINQEIVLEKRRRRSTSWRLERSAPRGNTTEGSVPEEEINVEISFPNLYRLSRDDSGDLISSGSPRRKVRELQNALVSLDYDIGRSGPNSDGVDGSWGRKTKDAVEDFQSEMLASNPDTWSDADIDGVVGEKTALGLIERLRSGTTYVPVAPDIEDIEPSLDRVTQIGRVMSPEEVPLEKIGEEEPFRMDTSDEPDDWDSSVAEDWEELQTRTQGFISAMPATIASMGHAEDEGDAKDQAGRIIGSTYRDAMEQARAVYNYPYKHDLSVRKQNPDLQPGDYFKSGQAQGEDRLEAMRQALVDLGMSGDTSGVYANRSSSPYIQVFDEWEALTGGDLDNHAANRQKAYTLLYNKIKDTYANGHGDGRAVDVPLFTGVEDILDKVKQIAGVDYDAHRETDHWHLTISENEDLKLKKNKRKTTLLERNIQAFLMESDPDSDADDSAELRDIADDLESSAPDYPMSAQLQDVMNSEELEAYGSGYDEAGDSTGDEARNDLADRFNNAIHPALVSGMDLKNVVEVFAQLFVTTHGYEEAEVLDAFSSYIVGTENPRSRMSERRLFEASRGRWQTLSGLKE